jgi:hypothetical protein
MPDIDLNDDRSDAERSVSAALTQLPLLAPPSDQFARIAIGIAQRKRKQAQRRMTFFAIAAALALAAILPFALRNESAPTIAHQPATNATNAATNPDAVASNTTSPSDDLIARNQWLEAMVRAQGEPMDAASAYASAELEDLIGMVDVQLSATEEPDRQTALWEQRLSLMQELASVRTQSMAVVRNEDPAFLPASYQID